MGCCFEWIDPAVIFEVHTTGVTMTLRRASSLVVCFDTLLT